MNFDEIKYVRKQTRQVLDLLNDIQEKTDELPREIYNIQNIITELQHSVTLFTGNDTELAKKVDQAMSQGDF